MALRNINTITRDEYNYFKQLRFQYEFNQQELNSFQNVMRTWINERIVNCMTCKGNFRELKNEFNHWFNFNEPKFLAIINGETVNNEEIVVTEKITTPVEKNKPGRKSKK